MKKFFTLIAVAVMAFAAQAATLTVCDGTSTSTNVPIYGLYVDTEGTMGQMIYSADMLTDMVGKEITGVTFYSPGINFSGATLELGMAMTDQTDYEDYVAVEGATALCSLTPNIGDTEMSFEFDEPFVYEGGNLMIQALVTEVGSWATTYFYGEDTPYYYSYYQYQSSWSSTPSKWNVAFLPKVTFTYEDGQVTPPEPPVVDEVGAPTFQGYTVDGIHGYGVYILPTTEGSDIMYRVFAWDEENGEWTLITDWTQYEGTEGEIYMTEVYAKYRVEAYAFIGEVQSMEVAYEFVVQPFTGINEMNAGKTVAGVRYFNMAGQEMQQAEGLTIVVTTYTDGTSSSVKVVK